MEKSALQKARIDYAPKLPTSLQGSVKVKEGAPTQSVDDQEDIKNYSPTLTVCRLWNLNPATRHRLAK